jgi:nitrate reductase NapD
VPICSLVIQAKPQHLNSVSASLNAMQGVEVHVRGENGKMVVSIDHPSRDYCSDAMTKMSLFNGVMSSSLVFEYQEELDADQTPQEQAPITLSQSS